MTTSINSVQDEFTALLSASSALGTLGFAVYANGILPGKVAREATVLYLGGNPLQTRGLTGDVESARLSFIVLMSVEYDGSDSGAQTAEIAINNAETAVADIVQAKSGSGATWKKLKLFADSTRRPPISGDISPRYTKYRQMYVRTIL